MTETGPSFFSDALRLGKARISAPVALTGLLGYVLYRPAMDPDLALTVAGVFLLAMGSGAINQIQERTTDARMPRTASRPLPSGRMSLSQARILALCFSLSGSALLAFTSSLVPVLIGIFTLVWYNLVYTPLKRVTAFAVLPGAFIGALPPLIGWTAAGGAPFDLGILPVAFLLFVGQMPHYWLLLVRYGQEFHEAGLPVITSLLDPQQIRNLSVTWVAATGSVVLMFPATPLIRHLGTSLVLVGLAVLFLISMLLLLFRGNLLDRWKTAFLGVNVFYLCIILTLMADRLV
ncbi:MAG: protoheme IX farnesyltransferase [Bacteroidales bacterium]